MSELLMQLRGRGYAGLVVTRIDTGRALSGATWVEINYSRLDGGNGRMHYRDLGHIRTDGSVTLRPF